MTALRRLRIDFHIGLKDILPTYLEQANALLAASSPGRLIKADVFKTQVKPQLTGTGIAAFMDHAQTFLSSFRLPSEHAGAVTLSQHAILDLKDAFVPKRDLTDSSIASFSRFSEYFDGCDLHLHLAIVPQNDFGPIVDSALEVGSHLSWADLVERLRYTVPSAEVTVWVFEEPSSLPVSFAGSLLGAAVDSLPWDVSAQLMELAKSQRFARPLSRRLDALDPRSIYLDDLFERDLQRLSKLSGVTLALEEM